MDEASARIALVKTFLGAELQRSKVQAEFWYNAGWIFTVKKTEPREIIALDHIKWQSPLQKRFFREEKTRAADARRGSNQFKRLSLKARRLKKSQREVKVVEVRQRIAERKKRDESQPPAHDTPHQVYGCPNDEPCIHKAFETPYERNGRQVLTPQVSRSRGEIQHGGR